jgi:hypothetical protein
MSRTRRIRRSWTDPWHNLGFLATRTRVPHKTVALSELSAPTKAQTGHSRAHSRTNRNNTSCRSASFHPQLEAHPRHRPVSGIGLTVYWASNRRRLISFSLRASGDNEPDKEDPPELDRSPSGSANTLLLPARSPRPSTAAGSTSSGRLFKAVHLLGAPTTPYL